MWLVSKYSLKIKIGIALILSLFLSNVCYSYLYLKRDVKTDLLFVAETFSTFSHRFNAPTPVPTISTAPPIGFVTTPSASPSIPPIQNSPTPTPPLPVVSMPDYVEPPTPVPTVPLPTVSIPSPQAPVASTPPSSSKISIFVISNLSGAAADFIQSGPRIVQFLDPNKSMLDAVKNYKTTYPGGVAIVRFYHKQGSLQAWETDDPIQYAEKYFAAIDKPKLQAMGDSKKYFDFVIGPNEFEDLPYPWKMPSESGYSQSNQRSQWNGKFWLKLAQLEQTLGLKTCVLSNPPNTLGPQELSQMLPYLDEIRKLGGALCYHAYTSSYGKGAQELYHRSYIDYFSSSAVKALYPQLYQIPIIIGELGYAADSAHGYLSGGSSSTQFTDWLTWYDSEIKKDSSVLGATLFQSGDGGTWQSFNVDSIMGWLKSHLR